jgi:hypothetical protein
MLVDSIDGCRRICMRNMRRKPQASAFDPFRKELTVPC